jgi:Right handed beta helix region
MKIALAVPVGLAFVLLSLAVGGHGVSDVYAIPPNPGEPADPPCLAGLSVKTFAATPPTVGLGQAATIRWDVRVPSGCAQLRLDVNGQPVGRQGALSMTPIADSTYALHARWLGRMVGTIASVTIRVVLPPQVTIDGNQLAPLFRQAVSTPNTTIRVLNGVELDLSRYAEIPIAQGVTLLGTRTPREPGPRLYTRTHPKRLFVVRGDNVRISGLRIEGADMGIADDDGGPSSGIYVDSHLNVEIDHNEVYGWKNSAIGVSDDDERISYVLNPETVRIHDNFIHHNQHVDKFGYGVLIGNGAYALIERNVFDYNRHAIAGDGSDDSGYRAYRNLVLQHGGRHHKFLWWWFYTHQFDMHGQDSCGIGSLFRDSLYNCGTAGHDIEIRFNSFLYTEKAAIKLRGTPQLKPHGAFVVSNVFAHDRLGDAVKQTESGLYLANNRVGIDGSDRYGACDFDDDGTTDRFTATGETWWYSSRSSGPWSYLNTSQTLLSQLTLGDFDGDGRCDVVAGNLISSGGTAPWRPR